MNCLGIIDKNSLIFVYYTGIQKQMYLIKSLKGRYYPSILVGGSVGSGYSENNKMLMVTMFPDHLQSNLTTTYINLFLFR